MGPQPGEAGVLLDWEAQIHLAPTRTQALPPSAPIQAPWPSLIPHLGKPL